MITSHLLKSSTLPTSSLSQLHKQAMTWLSIPIKWIPILLLWLIINLWSDVVKLKRLLLSIISLLLYGLWSVLCGFTWLTSNSNNIPFISKKPWLCFLSVKSLNPWSRAFILMTVPGHPKLTLQTSILKWRGSPLWLFHILSSWQYCTWWVKAGIPLCFRWIEIKPLIWLWSWEESTWRIVRTSSQMDSTESAYSC